MPLTLPAGREQFKGQQGGTSSRPPSTACGLTPGRDLPARENNFGIRDLCASHTRGPEARCLEFRHTKARRRHDDVGEASEGLARDGAALWGALPLHTTPTPYSSSWPPA